MEKGSIPILLVEDNLKDIEIIKRSLIKRGILNPIHISRDGEEAIDFLHNSSVQSMVLIIDIHLPKLNGMEVLKAAKLKDPEVIAIMLTSYPSLNTAIQSLRMDGAFDYIQKSKDDLPDLVEAVRLALEKRALRLKTHWTVDAKADKHSIDMVKVKKRFGLSEREMDVVKCICLGNTNKEIAEILFISELTVKGHLKKIYQKMDVHNRATLISKVLAGPLM